MKNPLTTYYLLLATKIRPFRLRTLISLGLIVVLLPIIFWTLYRPDFATADWFDMGYGFRQLVPVSNGSGEEQTDFQVQMTLDTASLIGEGKLQSDCDDIRVTDINGKELANWIEPNTCNTSETLVWTKVPKIPASGADLYVYYGNPSASSGSSTQNVFIRDMESAVVAWPMDDTQTVHTSVPVKNPSIKEGRNILINGGFGTDTLWTKGTGWSISGGKAVATNVANGVAIYQNLSYFIDNVSYKITYTISDYTLGGVRLRIGNTYGVTRTANGTYTETLVYDMPSNLTSRINFLAVNSTSLSIDDVSVVQLDIPASGTAAGIELISDGDMESETTSAWTPVSNVVLTKVDASPREGQAIRVANNNAISISASQTVLSPNKRYSMSGWVRGDGNENIIPGIVVGNGIAMGTYSMEWQELKSQIFFAHRSEVDLLMFGSSIGQFAEFDDVSVIEIDFMEGSRSLGVENNQTANGHLSLAYSFGNGFMFQNSQATNSVFNPDEGSLIVWVKASDLGVWSDGVAGRIASFQADANNKVYVEETSNNEQLNFVYTAGGVSKSITTTASSDEWLQLVMTWSKSNDQFRAFLNDVEVGSVQTGLGNWVGNLSSGTLIGAESTSGTNSWSGMINDVRLYDRALSQEEVGDLYSQESDIQAYYSENYPGRELVRKYNPSITLGASGDEEVGPGAVAEWKFDEGQGQVAKDSSTNGNDGTLGASSGVGSDDPTWIVEDRCVSGKCLEFDGGDFINTTYSSAIGTDPIVFSAWFRTKDENQRGMIVSKRSDSTFTQLSLLIASDCGGTTGQNLVAFEKDSGSTRCVLSTHDVADNLWHHAAIVRSNSGLYLYLDGKLIGSDTNNIRNLTNTDPIRIGDGNGNYQFNGFIDEVKIYPYARTEAQIKEDFNQGAAVLGLADQGSLSDGLVGYWKMDETSGTLVADASGNGNDGTLTNAQETGTSDASGNTTLVLVDSDGLISSENDAYNGMILRFTSACGSITSGTERIIADYTGSTKTITVVSALAQAPDGCAYEIRHQAGGKFGNGLRFDGVNDYSNVGIDQSLNLSGDLTVSAWVKPLSISSANDLIVHQRTQGKNFYTMSFSLGFAWNSLKPNFSLGNGSDRIEAQSTETINPSEWTHIVGSVKGNTLSVYVNGQIKGNAIFSGERQSQTTTYLNDNTLPFDGAIDDVRIYNQALSPSEIQKLYEWAPGPVGYWDFEEGSGVVAIDKSGNGNNGSINGATYTQGKKGKALNFDGEDDNVIVPNDSSYDFGMGSFTYSMWVKRMDLENRDELISQLSSGSHDQWSFIDNDDKINLQVRDVFSSNACYMKTDSASVTDTSWHYVTILRDMEAIDYKFYVDGVEQASDDTCTTVAISMSINGNMFIGGQSELMNGRLDEVKIYNYARTPQQIVKDMLGGHPVVSVEDPTPKTTMSFGDSDEAGDLEDGAGNPPVAEWKFDEKTGTTVSDASGNGNDGDITGATWKSGCKQGACLEFDGISSLVNCGSDLSVLPNAFTYEAWVKTTATGNNALHGWRTSGATPTLAVPWASGRSIIYLGANSYRYFNNSPTNVSDGRWHHIVFVVNGNTQSDINNSKMYVDGRAQDVYSTVSSGEQTVKSACFIGSQGNSYFFNGQIDHVKIYDYARTTAQIAYDYNRGAPVARWEFDECQGTTINDSSGNGYHGTLTVTASGGNSAGTGTCNTESSAWGYGASGKNGGSMRFDGDGDYVSFGDVTYTDGLSEMSVAVWFKFNSLAFVDAIVGKFSNSASPAGWAIESGANSCGGSDDLIVAMTPGPDAYGCTTSNVLSSGQWYHAILVYDGSQTGNPNRLKLYLNGSQQVLNFVGTIPSLTPINNHELRIGAASAGDSLGRYFNGQIDDVQIYNYALSAAQVKKLYNQNFSVLFGE